MRLNVQFVLFFFQFYLKQSNPRWTKDHAFICICFRLCLALHRSPVKLHGAVTRSDCARAGFHKKRQLPGIEQKKQWVALNCLMMFQRGKSLSAVVAWSASNVFALNNVVVFFLTCCTWLFMGMNWSLCPLRAFINQQCEATCLGQSPVFWLWNADNEQSAARMPVLFHKDNISFLLWKREGVSR